MKVFNYLLIDITRCRKQFLSMLVFGALAFMMIKSYGSMIAGLGYIVFAAIIMHGACFTYEQKKDTGFVNMLPGNDLQRVAGRFLYGVLCLGIGILCLCVDMVVLRAIGNHVESAYFCEILLIFTGVSFIFISLQMILFYCIGKGNSQQAMAYIHMLPGFILWIASSAIFSIAAEGEIVDVLSWIMENLWFVSVMVFVVGIAISILGIFASAKIVEMKDYD